MKLEYKISQTQLVVIVSLFLVVFGNFAFVKNVLAVYPVDLGNIAFLLSLVMLFASFNIVLLSLFCIKKFAKPFLIVLLLVSSQAAYFMDSYNIIISDEMIDNIFKTDTNEAMDLVSIKQVLYLALLGVLPSVLVYNAKIDDMALTRTVFCNIILIVKALLVCAVLLFSLSDFYASFFREHRTLRFYANPTYYIYSIGKYVKGFFKPDSEYFREIAQDAKSSPSDSESERKLVIFVLGETARADHFSLNGYHKKTNPLLEQENVYSFDKVSSCGTSTAHSVPCMFSIYGRSDFNKSKANQTENVLDILQRTGVNVIWLDNNSSSKGVADRVTYQSYKSKDLNPVCDTECRDEGMLANLQSYIDTYASGDVFIVLHQMGNHGPAYYKRYPKSFEKFVPICATNQLEQCTQEEISNTYDNALLYTDYFLAQAIGLLKNNDEQFRTALLYVSDHGESLGENNLYLHGLPYMVAPEAQTNVPMIMWFGEAYKQGGIDFSQIRDSVNQPFSHDNLFHTILGLMEIQTSVYDSDMDIISHKNNE